jgi:ABC-type transport system substrate-binding protein
MRRIIVVLTVLLALIGALWVFVPELTGNNVGGPSPTTTSSSRPPATTTSTTTTTVVAARAIGGSVSYGLVGEPLSLNPLLVGGNAPSVEAIAELWTIGLVGLDPKTHDPVAEAASTIPTLDNGGLEINDDGTMTVRYELDPEARWEDGKQITGFDVALTHELIVDPSLPIRSDLRELHSLIIPGTIEANASSLTLQMERPTIRYLALFPLLVPASHIDLDAFAEEWNEATWMSAGPFLFDSWEVGRSMRFLRNDRYWGLDEVGDQLPYLDSLEIDFFTSDEALLAAFRLRTVDAAPIAWDLEVVEEFEALTSVELQVVPGPEYDHIAFEFGQGRFDVNADSLSESRDFREFVARSLDREATVSKVTAGHIPALETVVGMSWPAASSSGWEAYTFDEGLHSELLSSALADLDREVTAAHFTTTSGVERTQVAGVLVEQLSAAGVAVDLELLDVGEFFRGRVLPGDFDIAEWAWRASPGPVGAVADLEERFLTLPEDDGYNFYRWGAAGSAAPEAAEDLQQRIAGLDGILDLVELRGNLEEIDALLAEDVVVIPLFGAPNAAASWAGTFEGFDHVAAFPDTWNAAHWHRSRG